ncbi:MAG: ribokinase [Deltaproteobacteria bacterium]|nr:ribokinase [Deltaproteobacteria bacterium]
MKPYDLVFVGHVTFDDIEAREGSSQRVPGGAPLFGAFAALPTNKRIAVITRMAKEDGHILEPLEAAGVDVYLQPSSETTHMRVVHPTENLDERLLYQIRNAGFFVIEEMPPLEPCLVHLGALTDREFTVEFMQGLRAQGFRLSIDMQNFVRQVDAGTGIIQLRDVPAKREIISLVDMVKLDMVEAEVLTGTNDPGEASAVLEGWGATETLITRSEGALVRHQGKTYFERYMNKSAEGRTGRGDTTMGAYIAWRLEHGVHESLRFAVALASIKMETRGPFRGTLSDVLALMATFPD